MEETHYHRQLGILPPDKSTTPITIIGSGGIGSIASLCLAKIGCSNITVFDHDNVEIENVPSQFFGPEDVGRNKAEAIADTARKYGGIEVIAMPEQWTAEKDGSPIVISAVDSMTTRRQIFEAVKEKFNVNRLIEGRMGAELMRIYSINPHDDNDCRNYNGVLYSDDEATEEPCTAKAIAYNTFIIGGLIAAHVKKIMTGQPTPFELIFDLRNYQFYCTKI